MKTVQRYDVGGLDKPELTPAGFLRVDGYLTRAGIFTYRNPDGTTHKELRSPEEVFKADSMSTFALAPVTDDHPPMNLTAENAKDYQRGAVTENLHQDGDHLRGRMLITDSALIKKMQERKKDQVSLGYTCDVEEAPGEWRGEKYDAVQKNIRGNHVAIVKYGRAGAGARVRMDAADAGMVSEADSPVETHDTEHTLKTFRHDGVSYEASEQVIELFERLEKDRKDAIAGVEVAKVDAQKAVDVAAAKLDQAKVELEKAKADASSAPEKIRAEIKARMDLEGNARKVLGKAHKLDSKMTDREVRVAVITKLQPKADLAAKSDEYVAARFDAAMENAGTTEIEVVSARAATSEHADEVEVRDEEEVKHDFAAAAARNAKNAREMWKEPIGRSIKS